MGVYNSLKDLFKLHKYIDVVELKLWDDGSGEILTTSCDPDSSHYDVKRLYQFDNWQELEIVLHKNRETIDNEEN